MLVAGIKIDDRSEHAALDERLAEAGFTVYRPPRSEERGGGAWSPAPTRSTVPLTQSRSSSTAGYLVTAEEIVRRTLRRAAPRRNRRRITIYGPDGDSLKTVGIPGSSSELGPLLVR
jgi:hypothetical protein